MNRFKFQLLSTCSMAPDGPAGGGSSSGAPGVASSGGGTASAPSGGSDTSAPSSPSGASPSGGEAAPAATPSDKGTPSPSPLDADTWAGFALDEDGEDQPLKVEPTPKPAEAATKPAEPTAPEKTPEPAAKLVEPTQQQATGQQEQAPGGASPLPSPAEPAMMSQHLLSNIEALADHLATTAEFKLSDADIEALNTDFASALPKLGARLHVRAMAAALSQMERVVPAVIERYMKVSAARDRSQDTFYQRWPQIDKGQHGSIVNKMALNYRRENPSATLEQMVEDLGPFVMMAAKIAPNAQAAPRQSGQQQPSPMATATRKPPASPFVPAVGGAAGQPAAPEASPWGGYGAEQEDS